MDKKKIILVGKAGSGKDYLREGLFQHGYSYGVSVTTRPRREGEIEGVTYKYLTDCQFEELIAKDLLYEHDKFNGWYYGTLKDSWYHSQVFIRTPFGVRNISSTERKDCLVVYLDVDCHVRRARLAARSDADSVERRMVADERDFEGFNDFDMSITDAFFCISNVIHCIEKLVKKNK